jgi:geranylgeranyl diphosphate synthase, type I
LPIVFIRESAVLTNLKRLNEILLPAIEDELRKSLIPVEGNGLQDLLSMMVYHLGWEGVGAGPAASGKRIRPLLLLLTCEAAGGHWECALPAAAAVELIHNFSLIHDDIEDNSPTRRGRPTLWTRWGIAQAINTGDSMFTLAHLALLRLEETTSTDITLKAARILQRTCLHLTQGQHLDIAFESRNDLRLESYWQMVSGKTAALIGASTEIGALAGGASEKDQAAYRNFGSSLGLAFQAQDDLLGIWGDSLVTGKSNKSDLLAGKKSLPVVYGLQKGGEFAKRWRQGPVEPEDVDKLAETLSDEGGRAFTEECVQKFTAEALKALDDTLPQRQAGRELKDLAYLLISRTT